MKTCTYTNYCHFVPFLAFFLLIFVMAWIGEELHHFPSFSVQTIETKARCSPTSPKSSSIVDASLQPTITRTSQAPSSNLIVSPSVDPSSDSSLSERSGESSQNVVGNAIVPIVQCFDEVKHFLNSTITIPNTRNNNLFCNVPCINQLQKELEIKGSSLSNVHDINHNRVMVKNDTPLDPQPRILVNSPGGAGTTDFMQNLKRVNINTNIPNDRDRLKHATPFRLIKCRSRKRALCQGENTFSSSSRYNQDLYSNYNGIIYIVGSSTAHSIFSLYSRGYERGQYSKISSDNAQRFPDAWFQNVTSVFEASGKVGKDVFGIGNHTRQWMDWQDFSTFGYHNDTMLTNEIRLWQSTYHEKSNQYINNVTTDPYALPIFFTDWKTALEAPIVIAAFLGLSVDTFLSHFNNGGRRQQSKEEKKLGKNEESEILTQTGASEIYEVLDQNIQEQIKKNYLLYGMKLLCSTD